MDIISILHFQLSKIKRILSQEIESGEYCYNYHICEDECEFLDKNALQTYLSTISVTNFTFLESLNQMCVEIIDMINDEIPNLRDKLFKEQFVVSDNDGILVATPNDFHAIYLFEDRLEMFESVAAKKEFILNYNHDRKDIIWIAQRCILILNWISKSYPETKPNKSMSYADDENNPHPYVFKDSFSFRLFERLYDEFKDSKSTLADFSFVYRRMIKDEFIIPYCKPEIFKNWISNEPFNLVIDGGLKTLDRCSTENKNKLYNTIFQSISDSVS